MIDGPIAQQWVAVALALAAAGIVKGATGIGYATIALPILASLIGLKPAMALIVFPTLAANFGLAVSGGHFRDNVYAFGPLYAAMLPGVAAGAALMMWTDPKFASAGLGVCMITYAGVALAKPNLRLSASSGRHLRIPAGLLSGILTGLTGSQVVPLVPYMMACDLSANRAIQAINMGVLILSALLGISLLVAGAVPPSLIAASCLAIVPALMGSAIGAAWRKQLGDSALRELVLVVVGLCGIKLAIG
jgi:uncharacterized protein